MKPRTRKILGALFAVLAVLGVWISLAVRANVAFAQQAPAMARFHLGGNAVEIPARFVDYLVFLPAGVNEGQPSLFQLDSTVAVSTIDPGRAAELGLTSLQSPVLNLSGVDLSLASLAAATKKDFGAQVGRAYEGTLGSDFFSGAVIEINYARQTVRLYDPATYQYSGRGKAMKLTFVAGLPVVHAKILVSSGKPVEGDFVVNTALDASLVVSQKFQRAHNLLSHLKTIPSTDFQPDGGAVLGRVKDFEIGPFAVADTIGAFPHGNSLADTAPHLAGEIGGGMLRRFIVTFDYPHQQIIFDPSSDIRVDEIEDMSGIVLTAGGPDLKRFEVTQVWPGTPGADAKIQKGDVIAGVNDEAAADMSLAEIRRLFRQPAIKYKLLIQRGSQTLTVNLQMRHLLYLRSG
ncbi:MAG TPA: PDZ domain-containing protein [Candidatus Acidoferrum sp.]|nr:PDZ domain-containing protein [Candidatus Acidoferrum sp.]